MMLRTGQYSRGSVALMTLCFLAALGIGLAGYLAVAKQAMTLSNRNYQGTVSRQLAEMGLERALWSINRNDWTNWTLSGTTATRTISFANSKYGAIGTTGTIKLRIDNYDAFVKDAAWSSSESYSAGDVVGYSGIWYRCVSAHSNKTPSATSTYWVNDKSTLTNTWALGVDYTVGDMAYDGGNWYSCIQDHTSSASILTTDTDYWKVIPYITQNPTLYYSTDSLVNWYGTWYRWTGSSWQSNPPISWVWTQNTDYAVGDVVCYSNGTWYVCKVAHNSGSGGSPPIIYPTDSSKWNTSSTSADETGANAAWLSYTNYKLGDVVYRSGSWYRCILAHNSGGSFSTTNWSTNPRQTLNWMQNKTYATNSVVFYQGTWYRNTSSTSNVPPASPWRTAASYTPWNSSTYYSSGSYVSYANVWYKCIAGHSGQSPNNSTYWQAQGAPVIYAEGQAAIPNGDTIKTQLRAVVAAAPLFPNAAAAQTLTFGTGATVDSYNPDTGTYASQVGTSTNDQAVLAGSTAVVINNAAVKGYLAAPSAGTSPYSPLVSYANSASVTNYAGAVSVPSGSASNVDLARISRSPYIPQFETLSPSGGQDISLYTYPIKLGTAGAATPTVYYDTGGISLNSAIEQITINGPVILKVASNFRIKTHPSAKLTITPTGSLLMHVGRDFEIDNIAGGIDNQTLDPKKCVILISDSSGSGPFQYSYTIQNFYGVIYLPNNSTTFTVGNSVNFFGAIYAQNLTFGDNVQLHYDTSLRTYEIPGADAPGVITDWRELTITTERASL
ncbi:MAG: hypothetical protein K9M98_06145 [Cephaloticoccus sp.]|nr:hypothetical protein [Cephaloticoccus sp.]MCF7760066.1 hypothetical protein [Cephaloticoccus sp.]